VGLAVALDAHLSPGLDVLAVEHEVVDLVLVSIRQTLVSVTLLGGLTDTWDVGAMAMRTMDWAAPESTVSIQGEFFLLRGLFGDGAAAHSGGHEGLLRRLVGVSPLPLLPGGHRPVNLDRVVRLWVLGMLLGVPLGEGAGVGDESGGDVDPAGLLLVLGRVFLLGHCAPSWLGTGWAGTRSTAPIVRASETALTMHPFLQATQGRGVLVESTTVPEIQG